MSRGDRGSRPWILLTTSTFCVSPVLLVLGVLLSLGNAEFADPYWLDLSAKATVSVLFLAPGFAALGAWDAARWRTLTPVSVRSWQALLSRHLVVVGLTTAGIFAITLAVLAARETPIVGQPRWDVLAAGVGAVTAYSALGFVAGRFLSGLVAAPLSFAAIWFWVAYTPAVQPFWLRNVTGNLGTSCCSLDTELVRFALVAPALLSAALLLGTFVVLARPHRLTAWFASGLLVTGAVSVAAHLVAGFGADPVRQRSGAQVCVVAESQQFCAWPENAALLDRAGPVLGDTVGRLRGAGLVVPTRLRESHEAAGGWSFTLGPWSPDVWVRTFSASPVSKLPPPCVETNGGLWPAGELHEVVRVWLETVGGTPEDVRSDLSDLEHAQLRRILATTPQQQLDWFRGAERALHQCEPMP